MSKRAYIYARVSTDEQAKGYSLQTQIESCQRYASEQGYTILDIFQDDYTGASMERPGLNQLRDSLSAQRAELIIVYDLDRLARRSIYQMLLEEEFLRFGANIEYVIGQYANTDEGRLQKQIRASVAEYEKAKILERSKRGKRGKAKSGYVLVSARPPYGYAVHSEPHKSWLEIDENEAKVVRMIYSWYIYGEGGNEPLTMQAIAGLLTKLRIPTRGDKQVHYSKKNGYGDWTRGMVFHVLSNETYTGIWYYGRTQMVSDGNEMKRISKMKRGLGKQVPRDRSEWIPVQVPPIIDKDTFDLAAQNRKKNYEHAKRNCKHDYLLSGRLRCSKCGYTYVGRSRKEIYRYYVCNGHQQVPVSRCDMPAFNGQMVDEYVWSWVRSLLEDPERIAASLEATLNQSKEKNRALYDRLDVLDAQLTDQKSQYNKLIDLYLSGDFPRELLAERKSRLESTIAALLKEKGELDNHLAANVITEDQMNDIKTLCTGVMDELHTADFPTRQKILDLLDLRGTLAIENNERILYLQCLIDSSRLPLSVAPTSHLSNTGATATKPCACRSTAPSP